MAPIFFTAQGLPLDTRLIVLGQEYHVHSAILKMHSAFFNAFLDSPDKIEHVAKKWKLNKRNGGGFIYEWVSIIENDGIGWSLMAEEAATAQGLDTDLTQFKQDKQKAIHAFDNILRAIHTINFSRCWRWQTTRGALRVTVLNCQEMLDHAIRLRHADMFRECIVYLAGNWDKIHVFDNSKLDIKVRLIIAKARDGIQKKIDAAKGELEDKIFRCPNHLYPLLIMNVVNDLVIREGSNSPGIFRASMQEFEKYYAPPYLQCVWHLSNVIRHKLLVNNLKFMRNDLLPGEDLYDNFFLCAEVDEKDFPWDPLQKDW
ncbi:uncharacterized protein PAC_05418 [Phialocephala subalpina]|uniref:BTB domain-containing protein n=1 Tax=Phialocephala subalpina TaxID=576137 RepID=A0A1L7WRY0_9HELO|nr:uncharacterized protein PAC_05418 [Phialocephala subalpina]